MSGDAGRYRLLAPLLIAAVACAGPPREQELVVDLAEAFSLSTVTTVTGCLEPGDSEARKQLEAGWSAAEGSLAEGSAFAWGVGDASSLRLRVLETTTASLRLRGRAFAYPGAPLQRVTPVLNGRTLESFTPGQDVVERVVSVPAETWRKGLNRLELRYSQSASPARVLGTEDERELAVAWYRICVGEPRAPSSPPRADQDGSALFLPFDTQIDYYLRLPSEAWLEADQLTVRGAGRLQVEAESASAPTRILGAVSRGRSPWRLELATEQDEILRLGLLALRDPGNEDGEGIHLRGARVAAPRALHEPLPEARETQELAPSDSRPSDDLPSVLIYMVDTLRADRIGVYGQERPLTPNIDAFARDAVVFEQVLAQSSWTRAAVASLFTGLWPAEHGTNGRLDALDDEAVTLAERFRDLGYETAAFFTNPNLERNFGFDQGFETFQREEDIRSERITESAVRWLEARTPDRPFFLYLHTQDPHDPYEAPAELRARFAPGVAESFPTVPGKRQAVSRELIESFLSLYDAEVANNDRSFGTLLDFLRSNGQYDETLIVLLSDHGEEFQEHGGWKHGRTLHGESVGVPTLIKLHGQRGGGTRVSEVAQHIDLLPTLLGAVGTPAPTHLRGRDLFSSADTAEEPLFSYLHLDGAPQIAVLWGKWKLLQRLGQDGPVDLRLFDRVGDPEERTTVHDRHPVVAGYLSALARARLAEARPLAGGEAQLDPELEQSLKALGYL